MEVVVVVLVDVVAVVVVGDPAPSDSYAPMSQSFTVSPLPSSGRVTPRWSMFGIVCDGQSAPPASIAGLPRFRARVIVSACGPGFDASGASSGSSRLQV